ncbi:hypothetical protein [Leisingera sp. JC1]|uniref:hypothetical protein n=4 Tax=unclassified Leisingera TaxID=2614906 RepID=UPI000A4A09DA|nr:hypothetical protein [Leisingera sp. JC1]
MKPWALFSHSVGMLVRNFGDLLKVFLVPVLLIVVIFSAFLELSGLPDFLQSGTVSVLPESATQNGLPLLVVFVTLFIGIWSVVAWHRFVLLEEIPESWVPRVQGDRIMAYFGRSIQIVLVLICMMIPLLLIVMLTTSVLSFAVPAVMELIDLPLAILLTYLVLRLSVLLPAAALGAKFEVGDAWRSTKNAFGDLLGLAAILVAAQFAGQFVVDSLSELPILNLVSALVVSAALALVNISILTTLYGHYVEGRPI